MPPLLLAAILWIPNGESRSVALPALDPPARLAFRARADYPRRAGSNLFLRLLVNGEEVGLMRDRRARRLVGEPPVFGPSLKPFDFGRWRIAYGPSTTNELVLDVSDLLRPGMENVITFEHGPATSAGPTPLVVEDLRLERAENVAALRPRPAPPDWTTPRLALP